MCGINGMVVWDSNDLIDVHRMNNKIIHRGPDSEGLYEYQNPEGYLIKMGMRRLAIIDLQEGSQPIFSEDEKLCIVYNGEIYNFPKIRANLIESGAKFKTNSDTEVILQLYNFYGTKGFSQLDGMFAFSIHDKKKNKIILARDTFGEKPLYLYKSENRIIWSSELKSMISELGYKPKIDKTGLNLYLRLTYIPAPYTIYEGITKVKPNAIVEIDLIQNTLHETPISDFKKPAEKKNISFVDAKSKIRNLVNNSVESRSISDVPIGTFLSGGVDSSIVSLCLANQSDKPINTFSVGFNKKNFDESEKANIVAKKINSKHHSFILSPNDIRDDLTKVLNNFDEPFADSSALPTYFIAQKTAEHVKVVLTGDGGDEVFGGYNKYQMGVINQAYTKYIPEVFHKTITNITRPILRQNNDSRGLKFKINKALKSIDYNDDYYFKILSLGFTINTQEILNATYYIERPFELYSEQFKLPRSISDFRNIDRITSLEGDMLVKVDRTCMLNSLEARAPFLNKALWDYTMQLPDNYLINKSSKKHILKKAFESDFPKGFLDLNKQGFGVPVGDWLRSTLKDELMAYIGKDFLAQQGIFNMSYATNLVMNHIKGKVDNTFQVWTYYCFQKWYIDIYQNV